jgi:hypothetical protein
MTDRSTLLTDGEPFTVSWHQLLVSLCRKNPGRAEDQPSRIHEHEPSTPRVVLATTATNRCGTTARKSYLRNIQSVPVKPNFFAAPANTLNLTLKEALRGAKTSSPLAGIATKNGIKERLLPRQQSTGNM